MQPFSGPVIDASVVAAAVLDDEVPPIASAALRGVAERGAIVPSLFWYEMRNVFVVAVRRKRTSDEAAALKLRQLRTLDIAVVPEPRDEAIWRIAGAHSLTAYDAAYAVVAVRENRPLATLDKALIRAGEAGAFARWLPTSAPPP